MEWGFTVGALAAPCFFQKQAFSFSDKNRGFGRAKNAKNKARTHLDFPLHRYKAARFFLDCVAITHDFGNVLLPVAFNSCRFWQPPSATLPPVWLAFHEFLHNLEGFHRSSKFFCPLAHRLCIEAFRLFIRMESRDFNRLRKAWHPKCYLGYQAFCNLLKSRHSFGTSRIWNGFTNVIRPTLWSFSSSCASRSSSRVFLASWLCFSQAWYSSKILII